MADVRPIDQTDDDLAAITAARGADAKNAEDVVVLRVGPVLALCEHFVIASAGNPRLVKAVTEEVEERVAEATGRRPSRVEGLDDLRWVLMDYGDLVVHVFLDEARRYYDLERLWSDVERVPWASEPPPA